MTNILVTLLDDPMSHERRKGLKKKKRIENEKARKPEKFRPED